MSQSKVKSLLDDARSGRVDSLGELLEHYRNYLSLLARTQLDLHLKRRLNPSDIVQETFVNALQHFPQFRGQSEQELLAWLRQILLRNLAGALKREVRAKKRNVRREISLDSYMASLERSTARVEAALAGPESTPSSKASRLEQFARLADRMARLPEHYREVIVLRSLNSLTWAEVSQRMERSEGAVRNLWLRALESLKKLRAEETE